ncbi:MAG: M48 family metalloprotease [Paracoccus sp. (in: a-proteobacteria)]|nr:M48 family metalloprotease [Paracoccus sp. (in: a-proteobacteria)]
MLRENHVGMDDMVMRVAKITGLVALLGAVACAPIDPAVTVPAPAPTTTTPAPAPARTPTPSQVTPNTPQVAARNFVTVMRQMEPVVTRECLSRRQSNISCNFTFVVDDTRGAPPNAFQTVDRQGNPVIGFTIALIAAAQNTDELAFVVGHEASHHILNHLTAKRTSATAGAVILAGIAAATGAGSATVQTAQNVGASVGSRVYSRDWELEADYLGAIITANAGYDPLRGADFFRRMPDPGNRILGSHPSNAQRIEMVQRAMADLRAGRVR